MMERNRRWGLLAFVAMALVVVGLVSLSSSVWATPAQDPLRQTTPGKTAAVCAPLEPDHVVFTLVFNNGTEDWTNVEFTDDINPILTVDSVDVQCQPGPCPADTSASGPGVNPVTVTMGAPPYKLPAGTTVTITIFCTATEHGEIGNVGTVEFDDQWATDQTRSARWTGRVRPCEEFVPEVGSLLLLGTGLAGLAGYAGMRWRARVR